MKYNIIIALSILLFTVNTYSQILQEGFEKPLIEWTQFQSSGSISFSRTKAEDNSGKYSIYIHTQNATNSTSTVYNEAWLISPSLNLSTAEDIELSYYERNKDHKGSKPTNATQQVLFSTNYSGSGNPNTATWTVIDAKNATNKWTKKTIINKIPNNPNVYIAFRYMGNSFKVDNRYTSREWYIDDIEILELPCSYTTIWNGSSWSNGKPNANTSVIIDGNYNTKEEGSFESCSLTVYSDKTVDIVKKTNITVNYNLTVNGILEVRNEGSLLMKNDDAKISVDGIFRVHKTTTKLKNSKDYTYWSSPVENINISSVFTPEYYNQNRLYYWDQSVSNSVRGGGSEALGEWIRATGITMQAGRGYISQAPTSGTYPLKAEVSFTGKPNNGKIILSGNAAVYNIGNPNDDLNLVGNPYPSAIDADEFIAQNSTSISGTLWFWTHRTSNNNSETGEQYTSNDYATYNLTGSTKAASGGDKPSQYITSGQGFMVQTIPTVNTIILNNSMRVEKNNNKFFRGADIKKSATSEKNRIWLNVESDNGGAFSQILIGFFENATDGVDHGYDGPKLSEGWVNLYSKIDTLNYTIQGLSSFNTDKKVPLAFQTYIEDETIIYTISIDKVEGILKNSEVLLVDNQLNITHDLKQGNYAFSVATAGEYPNRFTLQFTQTNLRTEDINTKNYFSVINNENSINIKSNTIISSITFYDMTGALLVEKNVDKSEISINTDSIEKGSVLIIKAIFEDNSTSSKKIILTK